MVVLNDIGSQLSQNTYRYRDSQEALSRSVSTQSMLSQSEKQDEEDPQDEENTENGIESVSDPRLAKISTYKKRHILFEIKQMDLRDATISAQSIFNTLSHIYESAEIMIGVCEIQQLEVPRLQYGIMVS